MKQRICTENIDTTTSKMLRIKH